MSLAVPRDTKAVSSKRLSRKDQGPAGTAAPSRPPHAGTAPNTGQPQPAITQINKSGSRKTKTLKVFFAQGLLARELTGLKDILSTAEAPAGNEVTCPVAHGAP